MATNDPRRRTPARPPLAPAPARQPTPPGPAAGHPIGPVTKAPATPAAELPPGIPPHMAGVIATPRSAAPAARTVGGSSPVSIPSRPLKPGFAAPDSRKKALRHAAEMLRVAAGSTVANVRAQADTLKAQLAVLKGSPEGLAAIEAEGLDITELDEFHARLMHALALAEVPDPPEAETATAEG